MSRRILIVDDEPEILDLLKDVLAENGYRVDTALDANGALRLIRAHIFDAAILDFNLPDMNGVMLHRQIRQLDPELGENTVFTSGFVQSEDNLAYYASYGQGFLSNATSATQVAGETVVDPVGKRSGKRIPDEPGGSQSAEQCRKMHYVRGVLFGLPGDRAEQAVYRAARAAQSVFARA